MKKNKIILLFLIFFLIGTIIPSYTQLFIEEEKYFPFYNDYYDFKSSRCIEIEFNDMERSYCLNIDIDSALKYPDRIYCFELGRYFLNEKLIILSKLPNIEALKIEDSYRYTEFDRLDTLPEEIYLMKNLRILDLHEAFFSYIPKGFNKLKKLEYLSLSVNRFPMGLKKIKNLKILINHGMLLDMFPIDICFLTELRYLNLSADSITFIPKDISKLKNLQVLLLGMNVYHKGELWYNFIEELPDSFCELNNLKILDLSGNPIESLPENFGNLSNLEILDLSNTKLSKIPESFYNLKKLKKLYLLDTHLDINEINKLEVSLDHTEIFY